MDRINDKLSIIVVTCNSAHDLPDFLSSLAQHPPSASWELIVVDNASTDHSVSLVKQEFPSVLILEQECNVGFARAVNIGAGQATGDCYLLLNPDLSWDADIFTPLVALLDSAPKIAAVTPQLVNPDGTAQLSLRRFPDHSNIWFSRGSPLTRLPFLHDNAERYTCNYPSVPAQVEAAAATCWLVRATAFDAVNGMDEGYFLYVEDTDICRRWANDGYEVWVHPNVTVTHTWGSQRSSNLAKRTHHRAGMRRYFERHHPDQLLKNAVVCLFLGMAGFWDRLRSGKDKTGENS